MEIFGYPLMKHLEVFGGLFLVLFALTTLFRWLDRKRSVSQLVIGAGTALLNTVYIAWIAFVFRAGLEYGLWLSMSFGTLIIIASIYPFMMIRNKLVPET